MRRGSCAYFWGGGPKLECYWTGSSIENKMYNYELVPCNGDLVNNFIRWSAQFKISFTPNMVVLLVIRNCVHSNHENESFRYAMSSTKILSRAINSHDTMLKYLINQIETKSKILLENLASRQTHLFVLIGLDQKVLMFGSDGVTV